VFTIDVLIPTARFVFSVGGGRVEVLPEHRSPEAFEAYSRQRRESPVTGMTTFPNSLLVHGSPTFVVDPGLSLQNAPLLRALGQRGLTTADIAFAALTHAHDDHAGALVDLAVPVVVHEREREGPHWPAIAGVLAGHDVRFLRGAGGELAPGVRWALTPGHTSGGVSYAVDTSDGVVVICGDIVGPFRRPFDEMAPEGQNADELLASWRQIRAWRPRLVVAGHLPPFAL
jgi:glyoxylase-like metal-dependent hydrolase (beta-lactamase superfamily II)